MAIAWCSDGLTVGQRQTLDSMTAETVVQSLLAATFYHVSTPSGDAKGRRTCALLGSASEPFKSASLGKTLVSYYRKLYELLHIHFQGAARPTWGNCAKDINVWLEKYRISKPHFHQAALQTMNAASTTSNPLPLQVAVHEKIMQQLNATSTISGIEHQQLRSSLSAIAEQQAEQGAKVASVQVRLKTTDMRVEGIESGQVELQSSVEGIKSGQVELKSGQVDLQRRLEAMERQLADFTQGKVQLQQHQQPSAEVDVVTVPDEITLVWLYMSASRRGV